MKIWAIRTARFREGGDLLRFLRRHIGKIPERSILVVTSKIVALAEGRVSDAADEKTRTRLIRAESQLAMKTKYTWLTIKDGTVMAAAGIDQSNADGKLILLPRDSFHTAAALRRKLKKMYRLRTLGILITDSRVMPLRAGSVGIALGYAGFKGIRDYRGTPDLFGRKLKVSRTDVADSLASAAVLMMGEGKEQRPLAIIQNAPVTFTERVFRRELHIDIRDDMYRPLFEKLGRIRLKNWK